MIEPLNQDDVWPDYFADEGVRSALVLAETVTGWVEKAFGEGVTLNGSGRETIAVAACFVVFEHHASVVMLTKINHQASAHALLRPAFEALARGLWVKWAAIDQLERFQDGQHTAEPAKLLRTVMDKHSEKKNYYEGLLETWEGSKETLHAYTHHRFQSLVRRSGEVQVDATEVMNMLRFSSALCIEAAIALVGITEEHPAAGEEQAMATEVGALRQGLANLLRQLRQVEQDVLTRMAAKNAAETDGEVQ